MKIARVEIENFRGLESIAFEPDKDVNVIVGPNAIGKTTILEAIRLAKSLLSPRYYQESSQTLISLGAISQHFQFFGPQQLDYAALARDPSKSLRVSMTVNIAESELQILRDNLGNLSLSLVRSQLGRNDEQGQFALTQFLSSPQGRDAFTATSAHARELIESLAKSFLLKLELSFDPRTRAYTGADAFAQTAVALLDQRLPAQRTLLSYFPADRAFPSGEVNIQISSADASSQVQSHLGTPANKYQRLKQTLVNGTITNVITREWIDKEFNIILKNLLPGKVFDKIFINQIGQCKVYIVDELTGRSFDIDSMSSGEKGVVLTFLLIRQTLTNGGILLIDEPELHLNPAIQKKVLPFLIDYCVNDLGVQGFICTHSPEVLGSAFDRDDCNLFHLRSGVDLTKIYRRDHAEMFEALRRLGASTADVLFARGTIFVEGEHDAELLAEGFLDIVTGYKITPLGGRTEVEKEITNLQRSEARGELTKPNLFIFDLDRSITGTKSTKFVRVHQWDRYCLENFLLEEKVLFEIVTEVATRKPESRGSFAHELKSLAMDQLIAFVIRKVYDTMKPDHPGIRPSELAGRSIDEAAPVLVERLLQIGVSTSGIDRDEWIREFSGRCRRMHEELQSEWNADWRKFCSGKRLIQDAYRRYEINVDPLLFKKRVVRQMLGEKSEGWRLIESALRDGLRDA